MNVSLSQIECGHRVFSRLKSLLLWSALLRVSVSVAVDPLAPPHEDVDLWPLFVDQRPSSHLDPLKDQNHQNFCSLSHSEQKVP